MPAINSTQQLAKIRSQIDIQQQIIGQLEIELQNAILGSPLNPSQRNVGGLVSDIQGIYDSVAGGSQLGSAFQKGVEAYIQDKNGVVTPLSGEVLEQDVLRHMLYQARALLGELSVEEQQWNEEAKQEKDRKKDLTDFAKA